MQCQKNHGPMTRGAGFWICLQCGEKLADESASQGSDAVGIGALPGLQYLPSFLAIPLHEFAVEAHPVLKLHRLCDAAEVLTRFCAIVAIGEVCSLNDNKLPENLLDELAQRIERPTFGAWRDMLAALLGHLPRTSPLVVPELYDVAQVELLPHLAGGKEVVGEMSLLVVRNDLVHGGGMTKAAALYYLKGNPAQRFAGWQAWLEALVPRLGCLAECLFCHHTPQRTLRLAGPRGESGIVDLSADLQQALASRQLHGHVLLLRDGRWVNLWPLCDFGPARLTSLQGVRESARPAPQMFVRAEETRLLYAALGVDLHLGERRDVVAEFRSLFRLDERKAACEEIVLDYDADIRKDAEAFVGRKAELTAVGDVVKGCVGGVLWLVGHGGIGKSFLAARLARNLGNAPLRWCVIAWRFRASDGDRCNRHAFFRHAIRKLGAWPVLGLEPVTPAVEPHKLQEQLAGLLDRVAELPSHNPRDKPPRVLFVLDGLDEVARSDPNFAEVPFQLLRDNAVWLCVGRPEESLNRAFRAERCTHLFPGGLGAMSSNDVRAMLLEGSGERKYGLLKHDKEQDAGVVNALVNAIVERADGLPLYVRLVVEDINSGHLDYAPSSLANLPRGLAAYYDDLLRRFRIGERQGMLTPLVVSVCWANAPLEEEALVELLQRRTVLLRGDLEQARRKLRQGLADVGVMLRVVSLAGGSHGYEPYHLTFRDHVRADETGEIGDQGPLARAEFCKLTCDWIQLSAGHAALRYVLRHGPDHLLDENHYEDLYRLARDKEGFLAAQARELSTEPEGALLTLMAALRAAIAEEHGGRITEFLLGHALRARELLRESPLEAARAGSLERALRLVDMMEPQRRILSMLLLIWEFQARDKPDELGVAVARLLQGEMPKLSGTLGEQAGTVLGHIVAKQAAMKGLCADLIGDDTGRKKLVNTLSNIAERQAEAGQIDAARETFSVAFDEAVATRDFTALRGIAESQFRALLVTNAQQTLNTAFDLAWRYKENAYIFHEIGEAQLKVGQVEGARETLAIAFDLARSISDMYIRRKVLLLGDIADCQAKAGDFARAVVTAGAIFFKGNRASAFRRIGEHQAKAGQSDAARVAFAAALAAVRAISDEDAEIRADTLREIGESQFEAGQVEDARATFSSALASARAISNKWDRRYSDEVLSEIATSNAKTCDFSAALACAAAMDQSGWRLPDVLRKVAGYQATAGQLEAARRTFASASASAQTIDDAQSRARWLAEIGESAAIAGEVVIARQNFDSAISSAEAIESNATRSAAFRAIAESQAKGGEVEAARQSFTSAIAFAEAIDGAEKRVRTLREIGDSAVNAGEMDLAHHSFASAIAFTKATTEVSLARQGLHAAIGFISADTVEAGTRAKLLREIAESQAKGGELEAAGQTFASAMVSAQQIDDETNRLMTLWTIGESWVKAGESDALRRAFAVNLMSVQDLSLRMTLDDALRAIADLLSEAQHFPDAFTTACVMRLLFRDSTLKEIAKSQAKSGDFNGSLTVARAINSQTNRCQALGEIAASEAKAGDFSSALVAAHTIDDKRCFAEALRAIAEEQANAGDVEAARRNFASAIDAAHAIDNTQDRARALSTIGESLGIAGEVDTGRQVFASSIAAAKSVDSSEERTKILQEVCNNAAKVKDFSSALAAAQAINSGQERAEVLAAIAEIQAKAGDDEAARQTFASACTSAQHIDVLVRPHALRKIAERQFRVGQVEAARQSFSSALASAQAMDIFRVEAARNIIVSQAEAGDLSNALECARTISDEECQADALRGIAEYQEKAGEFEAAQRSLAFALDASRGTRSSATRGEVLRALAECQAKAGAVELARQTFTAASTSAQAIWNSLDRAHALRKIGESAATTGEVHVAGGAFASAVDAARTIEDVQPRSNALMEIGESQFRLGQVETARQTFTMAVASANAIKHENTRAWALREIAKCQAKAGDFAGALAWAKVAMARDNVLHGIVESQMDVKDFSSALAAAQVIQEPWLRASLLKEIGEHQLRAGDVEAALHLFTIAVAAAQAIGENNASSRYRVLREIGEGQLRAEQVKSAQETFSLALASARAIKNETDRAEALIAVARNQALVEDYPGITETTTHMRVKRNWHLPAVGAAVCTAAATDPAARRLFMLLILGCAPYLDAALAMCPHLCRLFPTHAQAIARMVQQVPTD